MPVDQDGGLDYRYMERIVEDMPDLQFEKGAFTR